MSIESYFSLTNTLLGAGSIGILVVSIIIFLDTKTKALQLPQKLITSIMIPVVGFSAIIAPLGYQYIFGLPPCLLCWYQRIFLWPSAFIATYALFQGELLLVKKYAQPLLGIGLLIACYHVLIQMNAKLAVGTCGVGSVSCTESVFTVFGFLTIPLMSLISFISLMLLIHCYSEENK